MEKKNILFIGEINKPLANANGICIETLAKSFVNDGHNVTIASYRFGEFPEQEIIDGISYIRIKPTFFYRVRESSRNMKSNKFSRIIFSFSLIVNKIKKTLLMPLYPVSSISFIIRYYWFLKRYNLKESYDTVISIYFPIDSLLTGYLLKRKFKEINHTVYLVDTISNGASVLFLPESWTRKRGIAWEKFFIKHANQTLVFKAHEHHYRSQVFSGYEDKILITDVPLFVPSIIDNQSHVIPNTLIYTGSLVPGLRSPEYMLQILGQNVFSDYKIDLYTQGGFESVIMNAQVSSHNRIQGHGYISHEEVTRRILESTVLISIGNSHTTMIPSKTFEYIATGKPVIHFYDNDYDSSLVYFNNYNNCLVIDTRLDFKENTIKLISFLKNNYHQIDMTKNKSLFEMNTPEFTNKLIIDKGDY